MRSHLTRLLMAAVIATVASAVLAAPAQALVAPTFSAIDSSTPGHASVTVTAPDSAYVAVWLTYGWSGVNLGAPTFVATSGGQASVDLETWGLETGAFKAAPCGGDTIATCGPGVLSTSFTATDVQPVITFPSDNTIGPDQPYIVDAVDPDGGGLLRAEWLNTSTTLIRGGSAEVVFPFDSGGALTIYRCSSASPGVCRSTGISHTVNVNRQFTYSVDDHQLGSINPGLGTRLAPAISTWESADSFTFDWHVEDAASHEPVPGVAGTVSGLHAKAGLIHPLVDPSALTVDKAYTLVGALSFSAPDFGDFVTAPLRFSFVIDTTAPSLPTISTSGRTLYPYRDGYQDKVTLTVGKQPGAGNTLLVEVVNSAHETVRTFRSSRTDAKLAFGWTGTDDSGHRVPAGTYTIEASVTDRAGNRSATALASVRVIRQRVVSKVFKRTYSAAGTLEDSYVGKCSTLARPSSRGWAGSLGYYSNSKCSKTFDDSVVSTTHVARMPAALTYGDLNITVYGGATRLATRHIAYLSYFNRAHDWGKGRMLEPGTGWHIAGSVNGTSYVFDDRFVVWGVFNVKGSHYDVKSFKLTLKYKTLGPE